MEEGILEKPRATWNWKNRILIWLNTIIMTAILLVIIVLANVISQNHFFRHDITSEQTHAVSDETKKLLGSLNTDVKVYIPVLSDAMINLIMNYEDPNIISKWDKIKALLNEYKSYSTHFNVQPLTESDADIVKRLKNVSMTINEVLFTANNGEKSKAVNIKGLFKVDKLSGRILESSAEDAFTSAIKEITAKEEVKLYFTKGHGEADMKDTSSSDSISFFIEKLQIKENWKAEELSLAGRIALPDDIKALFIIDPETKFSYDELKVIREYIENGGKLFVILSPISKCELDSFLEDYGVHYEKSLILEQTIFGSPADIIVDEFPPHAINLQKQEGILFSFASPVEPSGKENPNVIALPIAYVNRDGVFAKTDLGFLTQARGRTSYDPKVDKIGRMNLAISVQVAPKSKDKRPGRIIALGSKFFLANETTGAKSPSNSNYAINCIRWLLEKEEQISIPPKEFKLTALKLKPEEEKKIMWLSIAVFPSIGIILGIAAWIMRRK